MSLFDTADGCFMNFAYDWAFAKPVRKVYYNLTITGLSVSCGVHRHDRTTRPAEPERPPDRLVLVLPGGLHINTAGFVIVGVFVVTWIVALCIWHFGRIEQKWESRPAVSADPAD